VTRLKWKLDSIYLEIVLILTQDKRKACTKRNTASEIIFDLPGGTPWRRGSSRSLIQFVLEIVLILTQDRCTVCVERTTGSEIILDTLDGTPW
jgi:hypothetical protein